jgi:hypothetical protein
LRFPLGLGIRGKVVLAVGLMREKRYLKRKLFRRYPHEEQEISFP